MMLSELYQLLAIGTGVILASIGAARLASRLGMPVLLAYLGVGLLLGQDVAGLPFDNAALAQSLGLAALAIILVEGGLTTKLSDVREVLAPATVLATIGVFVSVAVTAAATRLLLDVDWQLALLLGAIVSSTDAAAVFAVLRAVPLPKRLTSLVEAESGLNDAPTFILVVTFSTLNVQTLAWLPLFGAALFQLVAGAVIGVIIGAAGVWLLRRLTLPTSGLYPIAIVACGVAAYAVAGLTQTSGFLAAYVAGLVLGNAGLPHRRAIHSVAEGLGWIAQIGLFVMLGLLATPSELPSAIVPALVVGFALLLVARPTSVAISLSLFHVPWREQIFLSWAGLRGAVPIVLATIPVLAATAPGSEQVFNIVFVLVVVFTVIQAPALPWLARRLRLAPHRLGPDLQVELAPLDSMDADLIHVTVEPGSRLQGIYLPELRLPAPAATTLIMRGERTFVPDEQTRLRTGDQLVVLTTPAVREATERRLRAVARAGRIAHWLGETGSPDMPPNPHA